MSVAQLAGCDELFWRTHVGGDVSFWPFVYDVRVEWRDLDAAGHVNHAVYLTYLESARTAAYFALMGGRRAADLDIILARAVVDYRSAATLHDALAVEVRPGRVGATSFTLEYAIRDKKDGRVVVEAETVQVCFDYAANEKKPVPDELRAKLAA